MSKLYKPVTNYAQIDNAVLQDNELSFAARGLFGYMVSLPDDWDFSAERIADQSPKEGRKTILEELKNLMARGYLARKKNHDGSVDYYMYGSSKENPFYIQQESEPKSPMSTLPKVPNGHGAETALINKEEFNTNKHTHSIEQEKNNKISEIKNTPYFEQNKEWDFPLLTQEEIDRYLGQFFLDYPKAANTSAFNFLKDQNTRKAKSTPKQSNYPGKSDSSFKPTPVFKPYWRDYNDRQAYDQAIIEHRQNGYIVDTDPVPNNAWGEKSLATDLDFTDKPEPKKDFQKERLEQAIEQVKLRASKGELNILDYPLPPSIFKIALKNEQWSLFASYELNKLSV